MIELAIADPRQLFLFIVAFSVPLYLIAKNRERWLLAWICITVGIQLFDTRIIINLPAARIAGLMLIPHALRSLPSMSRSLPGRAVIGQFVCLVLTGIVFGFLFPWSDEGLIRIFNQIAQGRTIIYLIRTAADISIAFFVARQIIKWQCTDEIVKYILLGTLITALFGIFEFATRIDLLGIVSGLTYNSDGFRVRGFSYEPRGLGLMAVHGFLLATILFIRRHTWVRLGSIILCTLAIFMSGSTSALVALVIGIIALSLFAKHGRTVIVGMVIAVVLTLGYLAISENVYYASISQSVQSRLVESRYNEVAVNFLQIIAFRMEFFDGPALLFLTSNPIYFISGTGPGLVPLPATSYMPSSLYTDWVETGINSPPTMGLLLEVSNIGVMGFLLWFIIIFSSFRAFSRLARHHPYEREKWLTMRAVFTIGAAIYSVQTSPLSAIWPVFIGTGIAAAYLVSVEKSLKKKILGLPKNLWVI